MSDDGTLRWTGGGWVLPGTASDTPVIDAHYHIFPRSDRNRKESLRRYG